VERHFVAQSMTVFGVMVVPQPPGYAVSNEKLALQKL
jgi:hypothetical protein